MSATNALAALLASAIRDACRKLARWNRYFVRNIQLRPQCEELFYSGFGDPVDPGEPGGLIVSPNDLLESCVRQLKLNGNDVAAEELSERIRRLRGYFWQLKDDAEGTVATQFEQQLVLPLLKFLRTQKPGADRVDARDEESSERRGESTTGYYSPSQLAERHKVPVAALKKRLVRWRRKNLGSDDWTAHDSPRKNEPKFLYREDAVLTTIEELRARETSRNPRNKPKPEQ